MQEYRFRAWLNKQEKRGGGPYAASTVRTYVRDAKRVEEHYEDLDDLYARDRLARVLQQLQYSAEDARRNAPNPSRIPMSPTRRSDYRSLSGYRNAVTRYREFLRSGH